MEDFDYKIVADGRIIANFLIKYDRDIAMDALQETFNDCEFAGINNDGDDGTMSSTEGT